MRRTCILLQRGKVVAADALLGRFLPRLGPLVATQAASFFMFADGVIRRRIVLFLTSHGSSVPTGPSVQLKKEPGILTDNVS